MKADVWFPFYPSDYLKDTQRLTTEQHGAYLLLILDCWNHGGQTSDDDEDLASVTKMPLEAWQRARRKLACLFLQEEGQWGHKRVRAELAKAARMADRARENGRKGGRPGNPGGNPDETQGLSQTEPTGVPRGIARSNPDKSSARDASPSPSPSHSPVESSEPNGSAALDPDKMAWDQATALLKGPGGMSDGRAKAFFAKTLKEYKVNARDMLPQIAKGISNGTQDPRSWLIGCAKRIGKPADADLIDHDQRARLGYAPEPQVF